MVHTLTCLQCCLILEMRLEQLLHVETDDRCIAADVYEASCSFVVPATEYLINFEERCCTLGKNTGEDYRGLVSNPRENNIAE